MATPRFVTLTSEELSKLTIKQNAKNTDRATAFGIKLFNKYLTEKGVISPDIGTMPPNVLNNLLVEFYPGARTEKGELYKLNSMKGLRSGIQRYYLEKKEIDIVDSNMFNTSNTCFNNVLKTIKESGKGDTDHHPEIEPEDIRKLYESIDINKPVGLQEKVFVDILLYYCRRGREGLRNMTKSTFQVAVDGTGRKFVYHSGSELTKNHNADDNSGDTNGEGRIYATGGLRCPVTNFEEYKKKLNPNEDAFWQRPLEKVGQNDPVWYYDSPIGSKLLGNMMGRMSVKYKLSQRYTNHCVRVTTVQVLEDNNVEGRHIQRVSGHKSLDSIKCYARRLSAARKRSISDMLSKHVANNPNFSLLPDGLVEEDPPEKQQRIVPLASSSTAAVVASSNTSKYPTENIGQALVPVPNDDAFLVENTTTLTTNNKNTNNYSHNFHPFQFPVLNNCNNCTININIQQKQ